MQNQGMPVQYSIHAMDNPMHIRKHQGIQITCYSLQLPFYKDMKS